MSKRSRKISRFSASAFTDLTAAAHGTYFYRVVATVRAGDSTPSDIVIARLEDGAPTAAASPAGRSGGGCRAGRHGPLSAEDGPSLVMVLLVGMLGALRHPRVRMPR
jgi:hypothetical protein